MSILTSRTVSEVLTRACQHFRDNLNTISISSTSTCYKTVSVYNLTTSRPPDPASCELNSSFKRLVKVQKRKTANDTQSTYTQTHKHTYTQLSVNTHHHHRYCQLIPLPIPAEGCSTHTKHKPRPQRHHLTCVHIKLFSRSQDLFSRSLV